MHATVRPLLYSLLGAALLTGCRLPWGDRDSGYDSHGYNASSKFPGGDPYASYGTGPDGGYDTDSVMPDPYESGFQGGPYDGHPSSPQYAPQAPSDPYGTGDPGTHVAPGDEGANPPRRIDVPPMPMSESTQPVLAPAGEVDPKRAAEQLAAAGARFTRDREGNVVSADFSGTGLTDGPTASLPALTHLRELDLTDTRISDATLAYVSRLSNLEYLGLSGTAVSDEGMPYLAKLPGLRFLMLRRTAVTDAGLEHLSRLSTLEGLGLQETRVSEQGIRRLKAALPSCRIFTGG